MSADIKSEEEISESNFPSEREEYRRYLRKVIEQGVGRLQLPRDDNGVLQILSVGCLYADEAQPVSEIFSPAHFKGIELDQGRVNLARHANRDLPEDQIEFVMEDGREVLSGEENKYGLVIIRNPQLLGSGSNRRTTVDDWSRVFEASVKKTRENGWILVTTEDKSGVDLVTRYLYKNKIGGPINSWVNSLTAPVGIPFDDPMILRGRK